MPKQVILSRGYEAIVDDAIFDEISKFKWHYNNGYAARTIREGGVASGVKMHRVIMGLGADDPRDVDHINGNTLDNRRENLRVCTHAENMRNQRPYQKSKSGLKGVYRYKGRTWTAQIQVAGKKKNLGYFDTPEQAHAAYINAAKSLHGAFANTGENNG